MSKLDVKREHDIGRIYGVYHETPNAKFTQDGKLFDGSGNEIDADGNVVSDEVVQETPVSVRSRKRQAMTTENVNAG